MFSGNEKSWWGFAFSADAVETYAGDVQTQAQLFIWVVAPFESRYQSGYQKCVVQSRLA
jgi:hypothetical protein